MKFKSVLEIIEFCQDGSLDSAWYDTDLDKAIAYGNEYVAKELGLPNAAALLELDSFVLQNECAIVTAMKD
jgi:hypothetical protein